MTNGIINLNTKRGRALGFTSDRFGSGSYLWKKDSRVLVSFVESLAKGNFRDLVRRIHALGLAVAVPNPPGRMQLIVIKNGYKRTVELDSRLGAVEIWTLLP